MTIVKVWYAHVAIKCVVGIVLFDTAMVSLSKINVKERLIIK